MELKHKSKRETIAAEASFNRTFMELKRDNRIIRINAGGLF